jgi:hypothetical protein
LDEVAGKAVRAGEQVFGGADLSRKIKNRGTIGYNQSKRHFLKSNGVIISVWNHAD